MLRLLPDKGIKVRNSHPVNGLPALSKQRQKSCKSIRISPYQVSFTRKGKSSSKFVRKEDLAAVRRELNNYEVMKTLVDRWIDLATELSNLRLANKRP